MRRLALVLGLLGLLAAGASPAVAASREEIIRDCADDGHLQGEYTAQELRDARKNLPSDVAEYTDCTDVLRRAELGAEGGGGPGGTPGGPGVFGGETGRPGVTTEPGPAPTPPLVPETDADRVALDESRRAPERPVNVGGEELVAGASPLRDGYRANAVPSSLVITLVLLALAGLALVAPPARRMAVAAWHRRR